MGYGAVSGIGDGRGMGVGMTGEVVGTTGLDALGVLGGLGVLGVLGVSFVSVVSVVSVPKSSGRAMFNCSAQVSAGTPLGQHSPLIKQKLPGGQV